MLVNVLGDIVNEVQSAFIAERQMLDGPFILNEILQWCTKKKKKTLIFKVDFEKASIRLEGIGAPTNESNSIKVKQGDPLSPFLFILVMESLHLSFQRIVNAGMFKGIVLDQSLCLSHMFYADDAIFLGEWSDGQGESIQEHEMLATQNDTNVEQNEHMEEQVNFHTQSFIFLHGRLKYFLGIEVLRSKQGIFMYQKKYVLDLLAEIDWAGDKGDRRSTSGYLTLVGGNLVTWRSKKQKVVALSSAEAEFRGIARGITEVLWIRKLLTEIGYPPQEPSKVMSDNKAVIQISENPAQHDRTKHIEIDRHFIKEKLETEVITLPFVRSQDQLVDILTKAVNERILHECLGKLNFGNPTIQLEGEC
ncbi:putative copia-type protein [Tanacetum coccineum]